MILIFVSPVFAQLSNAEFTTFSQNNRFGLKDNDGNVTIKPKYSKLIRLGNSSWLAQKNSKYGIIDSYGNVIVKLKYQNASRILGSYAKLGSNFKYGVFNEKGENIIPVEYSSIDLLFGMRFLTCKDFKYGVVDKNGKVILENKFDEIYMPKPNIMHIRYNGKLYEITQVKGENLIFPDDIECIKNDDNFDITAIVNNPIAMSGYSAVTFTDYILKIFSSISPAHEATIDELVFSKGADTVSVLTRFSWLPKYPYTYARNYYYNLISPTNGPLNDVKNTLKAKANE